MRPHILDCTIRDGGYYCEWDFDDRTVARYIAAAAASGVDFVEIGFRSRPDGAFSGKYKFCRDSLLTRLFAGCSLQVAVMIDGKDFIDATGQPDWTALGSIFAPATESPVDLVRITATLSTLESVIPVAEVVKSLGYMVSINLMRGSMVSIEEITEAAKALDASRVDIMYLADSFGGLSPGDTRKRLAAMKEHFTRKTGFHAHDNLGLAFANSLAAIEEGVDLLDGSLLGMGRGAGNLRTEQLIVFLSGRGGRDELRVSPLFDVLSNDFAELQNRYGWGLSLPYMLSGVYNVHPTYAQELLAVPIRYSVLEVIQVLEALRCSGGGSSFNRKTLSDALKQRYFSAGEASPVTALQGHQPGLPQIPEGQTDFLVLGSGPSVHDRRNDLNEFIRQHKPVVLECNFHRGIEPGLHHFSVFLNHQRLRQSIDGLPNHRRHLILGMTMVENELVPNLHHLQSYNYPYDVAQNQFAVAEGGCIIPYDVVGMFAIALALRMGAKRIFLSGYDGYLMGLERSPREYRADEIVAEREMENFIRLLRGHSKLQNGSVKVTSLTPTVYDLPQESLYAFV